MKNSKEAILETIEKAVERGELVLQGDNHYQTTCEKVTTCGSEIGIKLFGQESSRSSSIESIVRILSMQVIKVDGEPKTYQAIQVITTPFYFQQEGNQEVFMKAEGFVLGWPYKDSGGDKYFVLLVEHLREKLNFISMYPLKKIELTVY